MTRDLSEYLGSVEHLAHLGHNYAEVGMTRDEAIEQVKRWAGYDHTDAFLAAFDAYLLPQSHVLAWMTFDDAAMSAAGAIGDTCVDRYAREIVVDADEWNGNADIGESIALVHLTDADKLALIVLDAIDTAPKFGPWAHQTVEWDDVTLKPEEWVGIEWVVVFVSSTGLAFPAWHTNETEAREDYDTRASEYDELDDELWGGTE